MTNLGSHTVCDQDLGKGEEHETRPGGAEYLQIQLAVALLGYFTDALELAVGNGSCGALETAEMEEGGEVENRPALPQLAGTGRRHPVSPSLPAPEVENLPTLPVVVARLVHLYASEDYSVEEIVTVLEADPPVSGRLLRLANSAYYGFPGDVDTLRRAVVLLGGVTVQGLVLGTTVFRRWSRHAAPAAVREIWVHAYLCGLGCRYLARRLPPHPHLPLPDTLFLAGLFHDVGKIYFLAKEPDEYGVLLETAQGVDLRIEERAKYGQDHAEMGGRLLESWGFPQPVVRAVEYHHGDGLRAELRPAWRITRGVHRLLATSEGEEEPAPADGPLPEALMNDLKTHLEASRAGAEAFYEAIA